MRKKTAAIILGVLIIAAVYILVQYADTGTGSADSTSDTDSATRTVFAMDTVMTFTVYGENCEEAADAAVDEIERLDALLSIGSDESEVSILNASGTLTVSDDTAYLITRALEIYESTGGLFDMTISPLMTLWGFPSQEYYVPTEAEIAALLPFVDSSQVTISGNTVTLGEGQQIDLGGIAKGYASSRIMEIYEEYGITSGMVSLGGNIQVLNVKPDGSNWRIGIQDPDASSGTTIAVLEVAGKAVITSGGYERYFEQDGETYIHILDPRTGYPVTSDLSSVTIVSEDGTLADGLSTALYIMGLEDAIAYWQAHSDEFDIILIEAETRTLYISAPLADYLTSDEEIVIVSAE